jgi:hypothetical protein
MAILSQKEKITTIKIKKKQPINEIKQALFL